MTDLAEFDASQVYSRAALTYQKASATFWPDVTQRAAELLDLTPGARVLDIGCGPGRLAITAESRVGSEGHVTASDISTDMLAVAGKQAGEFADRITFQQADMNSLPFHFSAYRSVAAVFSFFFAADLEAVAAHLWERVEPGGTLLIVTLTGEFFTPVWPYYLHRARKIARVEHLMPWTRTERPEVMAEILRCAGVASPRIFSEEHEITLSNGPEDWRLIRDGTAISRIRGALGDGAAEVDAATDAYIENNGVKKLTLGVLYSVARRPGGSTV